MTKEAYYEMCEMMGSEPIESEIPIEISDFPEEVQLCFTIYSMLSDIWDGMSGTYSGKDYSNLFDFFGLYDVEMREDRLFMVAMLKHIDNARISVISEKARIKQQQQEAARGIKNAV